jgi:hypothetical protein
MQLNTRDLRLIFLYIKSCLIGFEVLRSDVECHSVPRDVNKPGKEFT